jgi:hypothetical protein
MESKLTNEGAEATDYENMSDAELYALLKEKLPAVIETVGEVTGSNREKLIEFLKFLSNDGRQ